MINYSFHHIAEIINGRVLQLAGESKVEQLVIDSRKIIFPSASLFFALVGPRRDGHDYIAEVYQQGVRNFVISKRSIFGIEGCQFCFGRKWPACSATTGNRSSQ
jgi:alanine racemase